MDRRPRIPPLPKAEWDDEARDLMGSQPSNLLATFLRHRELCRAWRPFAHALMTAHALPARQRELLILRTAWNCRSEYEWGYHVRFGREAGLADADIRRVTVGPEAPQWKALDAALLRAADEMHRDGRIGNATWAALAAEYDESQLIEVCMLIGHYRMLASVLESLGIELDPGVPGFAELGPPSPGNHHPP